jgi:IS30 family transposase
LGLTKKVVAIYSNITWKDKAYQSSSKYKEAARGFIKNRISNDEWPHVVDDKNRMGEWEIDRVIGKGHSGALVTIVECTTSFTVSIRVDDKSAKTVTAATIALLTPFKSNVLRMTADIGKEFAYHEKMTESLKCDVSFADPY